MTPAGALPPGHRLRLRLALEPGDSRGRHVRDIVEDLARVHRVRGALVVAPDGLVISAVLPPAVQVEPLAALAATLGRELEVGSARQGRAGFQTALFSAEDGTLLVGASQIGYVVVLADAAAQLQKIRSALLDAVALIHTLWERRTAGASA